MYRACIASTAGHACVQLSASTHRPCVQLSVLIVHACNCLSSSCVRATVSTDGACAQLARSCSSSKAHTYKHSYSSSKAHTHTHTQLLIFQSTPPTLGRPVSRAREDASLLGSLSFACPFLCLCTCRLLFLCTHVYLRMPVYMCLYNIPVPVCTCVPTYAYVCAQDTQGVQGI